MTKWSECDGKEIHQIHWPDTDDEKGRTLSVTPVQSLILRAEYMGDRTEVWVACIRDGIETARYNARHIETIVWA